MIIEGDPGIECNMTVGEPAAAATAGAMVATAMRVVNAVPYVVAAPPGLVSSLDLPLDAAPQRTRRTPRLTPVPAGRHGSKCYNLSTRTLHPDHPD